MANENIGEMPCPFFPGETATIRQANTRSGKFPLYIVCGNAQIFMKNNRLQELIKSRAKWYDNAPAEYQDAPIGNQEPEKPGKEKPEVSEKSPENSPIGKNPEKSPLQVATESINQAGKPEPEPATKRATIDDIL